MNFVVGWCRDKTVHSIHDITLNVNTHESNLVAFYSQFGFTETPKVPDSPRRRRSSASDDIHLFYHQPPKLIEGEPVGTSTPMTTWNWNAATKTYTSKQIEMSIESLHVWKSR